jgi:hypothetical protein
METEDVMRVILLCAFGVLSFMIPAPAQRAQTGVYVDQSLAASVQPSGAQSATKLFFRTPLWDSAGILRESSKVDIGLDNRLTPSYEVPFLFASVTPIAFLDIRLRAGYVQFYRTLGYGFTRLQSYDAEWSGSGRKGMPRENRGGLWLDAAPSLRFALGPVAFVHTATLTRVDFGDRGYFYEPYQDVALRCTDCTIMNDTILVFRFGSFAAGVGHFLVQVPGSGYVSESAAAIAAGNVPYGQSIEIYAGAKAGAYLRSRYYRHEFVAAAWGGITLRVW